MKTLLKSAIVLSCFAIALALFQMSCQKDATADTNGSSATQLNKVIFRKVLFSSGGLTLGEEIWVCNYDGTGAAKVNITLPAGISYSDEMTPAMSPNGQKIFFCAGTVDGSGSILIKGSLYVCNSDGTGVTKIVDRGNNDHITLGGAY